MPAVAGCCTAADVDISPGNPCWGSVCYLIFTERWHLLKGNEEQIRNLRGFSSADVRAPEVRRLWQLQPDFLPSLQRVVEVITKEMVLLTSLMDSHVLPAISREIVSYDKLRETLSLGEDLTTGFSCLTGIGKAETDSSHHWEKRLWIQAAEREILGLSPPSDSGQTRQQGSKEGVNSPSSEILKPWLHIAPSNQRWARPVLCRGLDWRPHSFNAIVENNIGLLNVPIQVKFCSKQEWQQERFPSSRLHLWRNVIHFVWKSHVPHVAFWFSFCRSHNPPSWPVNHWFNL